MKKKYRFLFLIPVILLCTLFGCRKEKAELLFEDTEKIIEEDPAGSSGNSEENREAGRSEDSGGDARKESNIGKTGTAVEDTGSINAGINAAGTHE